MSSPAFATFPEDLIQPAPAAVRNARQLVAEANQAFARGDTERVRECLSAAVELDPDDAELALALGHVELSSGKIEAALANYTAAAELRPALASAHANRALALQLLGRCVDAALAANHALALDPAEASALKVLARIHLNAGQWAEAEKFCRLVLRREARDPDARQMLEQAGQLQPKQISQPAQPAFSHATSYSAAAAAQQRVGEFLAAGREFFAEVLPPKLTEVQLRNSRLLPGPEHILPLLPKGGICAIVGPEAADLTADILSAVQPAELHVWDANPAAFSEACFQSAISAGILTQHADGVDRSFSVMPDRHFDVIYVRGGSAGVGIAQALELAALKLKPSGWIVCQNYAVYSPAAGTVSDVCRAVNEFCLARGFEIRQVGLQHAGGHDVVLREASAAEPAGAESRAGSVVLDAGLTLDIGEHSYIHDNQLRNPSGALTHISIGKFCSIATDLTIIGYDHHTEWVTTYPFLDEGNRVKWPGTAGIPCPQAPEFGSNKSRGDIRIGHDVWIGYNVKLFKGVTIGDGAVIGACSLVNKSVEPYTIVAGTPARPIRKRFSEKEIALLQNARWWDWPAERINLFMTKLCSSNVAELETLLAGEASPVAAVRVERNVPDVTWRNGAATAATRNGAGHIHTLPAPQPHLSTAAAPPQLTTAHLQNSRLLPSRHQILDQLPKGGVCAEIGTLTGYFAKHIQAVLQPARLHVFDIDFTPFDHAHFAPAIRRGDVVLHQGDSAALLGTMPDRHFDFIYIDGDHSHAGVTRDLEQAALKIKADGWIVCNDYTTFSPLEQIEYGVCRAVNEFCLRRNFEIVYLGLHPWGYHDVALRARRAAPATAALPTASKEPTPINISWGPEPVSLSASVIREIGAGDEMFTGDQKHYFGVGESALRCIQAAVFAGARETRGVRRILDLPCGHGRVMRFLKAAFPEAQITACDLNRPAVDFCARAFGAQPVYSHLDISRIPLTGKYDLIWCGSLLTHLEPQPCADLVKLFNSLLNPGGLAVFTTHGRWVERSLATGRYKYGLPDPSVASLLKEYYATGFGYADYPGHPGYGISVSSPAYVLAHLASLPDLKLVSYHEKGWDNHQDVVCLQKQSPAEPLG